MFAHIQQLIIKHPSVVAQATYLAAAAILKHWKIALSYLGHINPTHLKINYIPMTAQVRKQVTRSARGSHG